MISFLINKEERQKKKKKNQSFTKKNSNGFFGWMILGFQYTLYGIIGHSPIMKDELLDISFDKKKIKINII